MSQQTLDFFVKRKAKPESIPLKKYQASNTENRDAKKPRLDELDPQKRVSQNVTQTKDPVGHKEAGLIDYRRGNSVDPLYLQNATNRARHEAALKKFGPKPKVKAPKRRYKPMHEQFIQLKQQYPDTILFIEMGFRYRTYGHDAVTTARHFGFKEANGWLSIDESTESDILYENFATFAFPTHRLHYYVQKMVDAGHKVGVVNQSETSAVKKASSEKSGPFKRQVSAIYTKGTFINDFDIGAKETPISGGTIMAIYEFEPRNFAICSVQPFTGEIIHDKFVDSSILSELETRLLHIEPCEILQVGQVSPLVTKLIETLQARANIRHETVEASIPDLEQTKPLDNQVQIAAQCLYDYLGPFGLQQVFELSGYKSFNTSQSMYLNGNTLTALEIFQNLTDFKPTGSLFWVMDHTNTKFGQRLLKKWIAQPLLKREALENRVDAVAALIREFCTPIQNLRDRLKQVPDLERLLLQIHYGRITRKQLYEFLVRFHKVCSAYTSSQIRSENLKNPLLRELFESVPLATGGLEKFLRRVNPQGIDTKLDYFYDIESGPIAEQKEKIASIEARFQEFIESITNLDVKYVTILNEPFFIETKMSNVSKVPKNWQKSSSTKAVARFRTPETFALMKELDLAKEQLEAICDEEYTKFVAEIKDTYPQLRATIMALSEIDCLMSLAALSSKPGYTKVDYVDENCIEIQAGRHPAIDELSNDDYIPNDTKMYNDHSKAMVITGPNMGGKSSYVRQCALIVIMSQVGAFVPARKARMSMVDAIYTRMGAYDNMIGGESTFQVELKECAHILQRATWKSLVLLDEIGRGTSTIDGVAIAYSVLDYIVEHVKSFTLFITHYPVITEIAKKYENVVTNWCMEFSEDPDSKIITFLYRIVCGVSHRSYGLNVARLAEIPQEVVTVAAIKSQELEREIEARRKKNMLVGLVKALLEDSATGQEVSQFKINALKDAIKRKLG